MRNKGRHTKRETEREKKNIHCIKIIILSSMKSKGNERFRGVLVGRNRDADVKNAMKRPMLS